MISKNWGLYPLRGCDINLPRPPKAYSVERSLSLSQPMTSKHHPWNNTTIRVWDPEQKGDGRNQVHL